MRHDILDAKPGRKSFVSKHLNRTTSSLTIGGFNDPSSRSSSQSFNMGAMNAVEGDNSVFEDTGFATPPVMTAPHSKSGDDDMGDRGDKVMEDTNGTATTTPSTNHLQEDRCEHGFFVSADFTSPYLKYFKKLLTVNLRDFDVLKKHNLWVPAVANDVQSLVMGKSHPSSNEYLKGLYANKTSPLFVSNPRYIPSFFDAQTGSTILPSLFSEYKLPPLVYSCAIEFNDQVIILGGLMPCYRNNSEIPDLSKFYMDGIKNLPPPLLPSLINNPAMISNPYIYSYSVNSSRISRLEVTGFTPPPLLCMTASKLTDRHICLYGGFEIKTESSYDEKNDRMYVRRSAFLNNTVYVLDTVSFKFTKIEIIAQPYQSSKYPGFSPRFGHMQISVSNMVDVASLASTDTEGDTSSPVVLSTTSTKDGGETGASVTSATAATGSGGCDTKSSDGVTSSRGDSKQTSGADQSQSKLEDQGGNSTAPPSHPPLLKNTSNYSIGAASVNGTSVAGTGANSSGHLPPRMYTIVIFGGYKQTGDDKYEAMNDMWRLDLKVLARGKKGYLKFADTVTAVRIPVSSDEDSWPSSRAFFAYAAPDVKLFGKSTLESDLLKRLDEGFKIEYDFIDDYYQKLRPMSSAISHQYGGGTNVGGNNPTNSSRNSVTVDTNVGRADVIDDASTAPRIPATNTIQPISQRFSEYNRNSRIPHPEQDGRGRKFIIHGGASNTEVLGDMWCFDLDTLKWFKFRTGVPPDNHGDASCFITKDRSIKLVGHTMIPSGSAGICVGGLSQEAVDYFYKKRSSSGTAPVYRKPKFGNSFINVFDLSSEYLKIRRSFSSDQDREWLYLADDLNEIFTEAYATEYDVISATGAVVESHGSILISGGCLIFRHRIEDIYLRGALIEFPLPTMSRAQYY